MTQAMAGLQHHASTDRLRGRAAGVAVLALGVLLLIWPAILNGYPLVFSDTGTYILQTVERHLGWDRPVFYSIFLLALHWTITAWPVIVAQALLVLVTIRLVQRTVGNLAERRLLLPTMLLLSGVTSLPWFTSQLMPDFLTALLPLVLAMLVLVPERLAPWERWALVLFGAAICAIHLSHLPISLAVLAVMVPARSWLGATTPLGRGGLLRLALVPLLAGAALMSVNLVARGSASLSPYGNVFLLTRMIYDGPGLVTLRRDCPSAGWRLCGLVGQTLPENADDFLWSPDSPLARLGGPVAVSGEAGEIIRRSIRAEPLAVLRAAMRDTLAQLTMIDTGDGLTPWPVTVTPVIRRDFPRADVAAYEGSLQTNGKLVVPDWLQLIHHLAAALGIVATVVTLVATLRRRHPVAGLCAAVLICILANGFVTGALSGPHDRYESRVVWLAVLAPAIAVTALGRREPAAPAAPVSGGWPGRKVAGLGASRQLRPPSGPRARAT
jgi:hypothetical protein